MGERRAREGRWGAMDEGEEGGLASAVATVDRVQCSGAVGAGWLAGGARRRRDAMCVCGACECECECL